MTDPAAELRLKGSDGRRLRALFRGLAAPHHFAWLPLTAEQRTAARDTFRILLTPTRSTHLNLAPPHLRQTNR